MSDIQRNDWRNPTTLRTIAERAGVHPSTVSRALRSAPDVSTDSTLRIRAIAQELGYAPHPGAASMRTRRTYALGVIVSRLTDVVMATLYEGIEEAALELGYQALVASSHDRYEEQCRRVELMLSRRVDGLLIADAHRDGRYVRWVETRGVPFLLLMRSAGDRPSVTADEYLGGRLAGAHLAGLGHRRVGVLAGLPFSSAFTARTAGCVDALREHGVEVPEALIVHGGVDPTSGRAGTHELLAADEGITAVFAVNDHAAIGAGRVLRDRGRRLGRDVALVGYNDVPIAEAAGLTTVRNPLRALGSIATRLLIDQMAGRTVDSVRLAPELIVRASSAPART